MLFAMEALRFTREVTDGKGVRLEYDRQRTDTYGHTLAYVYLDDGTLLNAELIRQGYAFVYTRYPFRLADEFRRYEQQARENRRGLWKPLTGDPVASNILYLYESLTEEGKRRARQALTELNVTDKQMQE